MNWDRDEPPKPLSIERIHALLAPWLGAARVTSAKLLKGGLMNRNFRLELDGAPSVCILRLYDGNRAACAKEVAVLELIRRDVPVAEVLYANVNGDGEEPPFVVMTEVGGAPLFALRQGGDAHAVAGVSYDAGRVLARIAAYRFDRTGLLTSALGVEALHEDPATTASVIDHFIESPFLRERIGVEDCARLRRFARDREPAFDELRAQPSLVHGDFNSPNVFGERIDGEWRVSAVLDWEFAFAASFYCDVGNFVRYHRRARPRYAVDFSRGLRDGGLNLPENWLAIARLADLPALCELLSRPRIPDVVIRELRDLLLAVLDERDI